MGKAFIKVCQMVKLGKAEGRQEADASGRQRGNPAEGFHERLKAG